MPKIVVQTERPTETSPGAVLEGYWELIDGKVIVTDLQGRPIGNAEVPEGDSPTVIAGQILRRGRQRSSFHRQLPFRDVAY
jgi:hypothetical protein